jgi:hypothetical protein
MFLCRCPIILTSFLVSWSYRWWTDTTSDHGVNPLCVQRVSALGEGFCCAETRGWATSQTTSDQVQTATSGSHSCHGVGTKNIQTVMPGAVPGRALYQLLREAGQHSNPCRDLSKAHGPSALFHQTSACPTPPFSLCCIASSCNLIDF